MVRRRFQGRPAVCHGYAPSTPPTESSLGEVFCLNDNRARCLFSRTYQRPQLRKGRQLLIRAHENATSRSFVFTEQLQHEWNRR